MTLRSAEINKSRYSKGIQARYRVYTFSKQEETKLVKGSLSPEFNHTKVFSFKSVDQALLDFFETGSITFMVYGIQEDNKVDPKLSRMSTKVRYD